jgi:CheY-like chemotaxis protein
MALLIFIVAVIVFVLADILIRYLIKNIQEKKARKEREEVLNESLRLDFSEEAKTLKRAEVENPKARILCVDDEQVILDSFRKILVLDGYSVDTVERAQEALTLIRSNHYDFVFMDLKMPEMDGVEATKAVKHLRPDIDVIIITGYASVETAVETMKYGAMDYVQKPFTEDELLDFVKKILIRRQDRIKKQLKPKVHITHMSEAELFKHGEFAIPGGVFISKGHSWANVEQSGQVKVGIDDFAKKLIGRIDDIEFPNVGMQVQKGDPLFNIRQGNRKITFNSPVSGNVIKVNSEVREHLDTLEISPYEKNFICIIDADNLDNEIKELYIGNSAVDFYQEDIDKSKEMMKDMVKTDKDGKEIDTRDELYLGEMENLDSQNWQKIVETFFSRE